AFVEGVDDRLDSGSLTRAAGLHPALGTPEILEKAHVFLQFAVGFPAPEMPPFQCVWYTPLLHSTSMPSSGMRLL
ncbi:MAG: hypothetical protein VCE12_16470, partial [Candidatus Latescibacterota bacterium]